MEQDAAAEHLQVIRTLMERSALYRRTLAPVMLYIGSVGVVASLGGIALGVESLRAFCAWWFAAAALALAGTFGIARLQAVRDREPLWSPPTLRVTHAVVPPLAAGFFFSTALALFAPDYPRWLFVLANALFYGCAAHAAGFFIPRGMKIFGWSIIAVTGALLFAMPVAAPRPDFRADHALMGGIFGILHLACGVYLYATEPRKTA